jgi:hypothetical protein
VDETIPALQGSSGSTMGMLVTEISENTMENTDIRRNIENRTK